MVIFPIKKHFALCASAMTILAGCVGTDEISNLGQGTATPTPAPVIVVPTPTETPIPVVGETPTLIEVGSCMDIDLSIWGVTYTDGKSRNSKSDIQNLIDRVDHSTDGFADLEFDDNGCPTFAVPNIANTSGGSSYPRSELRELIVLYSEPNSDDTGHENNWVTSLASSDDQLAAAAVDGNMKATLRVNSVSVDADKEDQVGRIVVGQIHASDHEPVKIYYRKLPEHTKGSVFFTVDGSDGKTSDRVNVIGFTDKNDASSGSDSDDPEDPVNGIPLGAIWSYEIDLTGDTLRVTVTYDGVTYTTADSIAYTKTRNKVLLTNDDIDAITIGGFYHDDGEYMYFKAGLYNQNNTGESDPDYASVTFYQIDVTH